MSCEPVWLPYLRERTSATDTSKDRAGSMQPSLSGSAPFVRLPFLSSENLMLCVCVQSVSAMIRYDDRLK